MTRLTLHATATALGLAACVLSGARTTAQQNQTLVWAPRPTTPAAYVPPMKPHVRLADLKAAHRGQARWRELVVDDGALRAEYILEPPGSSGPKRFHSDTRAWWVVVDGQMRVEIEGQPPFTATKGSLVQVPKQTIYTTTILGDLPSLRFEVGVAGVKALYGQDVQPPALPGANWVQVLYARRPAPYDNGNQPHVNLYEAAKVQGYTGGRVVRDDHSDGMWIYGYEKDLPPLDPKDRGHFHPESPEFWLIMAGQIRYDIQGVPVFTADEGDFAYAPASTYHLARFAGPGPSCRLSIARFGNDSTLREP